jgi:hypothetical protein
MACADVPSCAQAGKNAVEVASFACSNMASFQDLLCRAVLRAGRLFWNERIHIPAA